MVVVISKCKGFSHDVLQVIVENLVTYFPLWDKMDGMTKEFLFVIRQVVQHVVEDKFDMVIRTDKCAISDVV